MPPLDLTGLGPGQRVALQRITSGPRGKLLGPFAVLLRTPELMDSIQKVGAHLRYEKTLDAHLFELVVLMVARRWNQGFEWAHHQPLALAAGLDQQVVDAVGHGRRPETDDADVALVWALVEQLHDGGGWDDDSYARAVQRFGEEGVIELVVTVGYYCTLALVMNVAGTPPEEGPRLPGPGAGAGG